MPKTKKSKKQHNKIKVKQGIKININVDNSKRTTTRRQPQKPANMLPFVNFPSYQPARQVIQEVRPNNYNSPDLSKIDEQYQKQFKTYLETTDKAIKEMIEKHDDTLNKKNTAPPPPPPPPPQPGAYNNYTDYEGNEFFEEPIPKKQFTKDDSNLNVGYNRWDNKNKFTTVNLDNNNNEFKANQMYEPDVEVKPLDTSELIRNAAKDERDKAKKEIKKVELDENKLMAYERYKILWQELNPDKQFNYSIDKYNTQNWTIQANKLEKKIDDKRKKEEDEKQALQQSLREQEEASKSKKEKRKYKKSKREIIV
jgi:hypothetical protein